MIASARGHGQNAGATRAVLYDYPLPGVDEGLFANSGAMQLSQLGDPSRLGSQVRLSSATIERTGQSGAPYVAGQVIVKFRDDTPSAVRLSSLARMSAAGTVPERPSYANFDVVPIDPAADAEAMAGTFRQRPEVEYAQPAYRVHATFVPNDPFYSQVQWNFPLIDLERAWDIQMAAGSSVVVAVLDSGVAFENKVIEFTGQPFVDPTGVAHPGLGTVAIPFAAAPDLFTPGRFVAPYDFIWNDAHPVDLHLHGTHVAGTIGELTNNLADVAGIAFNAKLMPVKVIGTEWDGIFGAADLGSDSTVARGIQYAADNGAKVINMSIGRSGPPAPVVEAAIRYAVGKGAFIAIAAGNDFANGNPTETFAEIASRVQGAVSVAAVDRDKNHAPYSSTGPYIELAAPGGNDIGFGSSGFVYQQTFDLRFGLCLADPRPCGTPASFDTPRFDVFAVLGLEGTSMAAPHVSGVAALLIQQGITDPAAVEAALEHFALDLGPTGRDDMFGYGLIQAREALRGLGLAK
ncbi:MAG TPA: S8 family serine peptidase [Vicinamibacterales bacterium]|nr:S8 family serine peptidase [Vicinamibacterales bacterium]